MTRTFAERRDGRREVADLIREIQQRTAERKRLRARTARDGELDANEREIDELRWLLADAARRGAGARPGGAGEGGGAPGRGPAGRRSRPSRFAPVASEGEGEALSCRQSGDDARVPHGDGAFRFPLTTVRMAANQLSLRLL